MFTDRLQYLLTISKFYKHQLQLFLQSISLFVKSFQENFQSSLWRKKIRYFWWKSGQRLLNFSSKSNLDLFLTLTKGFLVPKPNER